jgi:hypothetical protein
VLNYTTMVAPDKTIAEIQKALSKAGASAISVTYGDGGVPDGLTFTVNTTYGPRSFRLPVRAEAVHKVLTRKANAGHIRRSYSTRAQAERTAWRIVKDWLLAQLAILEAETVTLDEIMLPYMIDTDSDVTVYERYTWVQRQALTRGKD